jgi:hypothetical protein
LGLGLSKRSHTPRQIERLKALNMSHVRSELHLGDSAAHDDYARAVDIAARIGAPLEIAVYLSKEHHAQHELESLAGWVGPENSIARWLIFQEGEKTTRPAALEAARRVLGPRTPHAQFGGGSAAYFTELNRERPELSAADVLCYSINPQVHAFDNTSLIENALAIGYTVESARERGGGRPIAITPITLRPRFNPDATGAPGDSNGKAMPANVDPRQMSLFGAAWTLASFKTIAESGAASVTYYETVGWLGVMERDEGSPLPDQFRSIAGGVFPMYHVFDAIGEFRGGEIVACDSTEPLAVAGLVLRNDDRRRIVLANLTPHAQSIAIDGDGGEYRQTRLDESNATAAMEQPESFRARQGTLMTITPDTRVDMSGYSLIFLDRR